MSEVTLVDVVKAYACVDDDKRESCGYTVVGDYCEGCDCGAEEFAEIMRRCLRQETERQWASYQRHGVIQYAGEGT